MATKKRVEQVAGAAAGLLVVAWALERFAGDDFALGVLASCAPRGLWMGVAFAVVLAALASRAWWALAAGVLCAIFAIGPLGGFTLGGGAAGPGASLRVVQYNVNKWDAGAERIAHAIESMSPDVVCLEEAGAYHWLGGDQHPDAMKRAMPGWRFVGRGEILIATKLEVVAEHVESLVPGPDARPLVEAVVRAPSGEVSVIAVHLVPTLPFDTWAPDRGAAQGGSLVDVAHVRAKQIEHVRAYAANVHRPVVVCGDFNTAPTSPPIRALAGTLEDAFALRGAGFGFTAPTRLPQQRIDYVFVRGLGVSRVTVGDATTSDHHPVIADLVIATSAEAR